jgi:hypothetical protein
MEPVLSLPANVISNHDAVNHAAAVRGLSFTLQKPCLAASYELPLLAHSRPPITQAAPPLKHVTCSAIFKHTSITGDKGALTLWKSGP